MAIGTEKAVLMVVNEITFTRNLWIRMAFWKQMTSLKACMLYHIVYHSQSYR